MDLEVGFHLVEHAEWKRRWTGPGCSEATGYRPVGKTATGVVEWERVDEVSVVDEGASPGARVTLIKRADHTRKEATPVAPSLTESIAKALAPAADDDRLTRDHKRIAKAALDEGITTAERVVAETALEGIARTIHKRDGVSLEQAYVRALSDPANADLVNLLD